MHLKIKRHFDAAHQLVGYEGACANLHGHRWEVEFAFEAEGLDKCGIAVDFKVLKHELDAILPDHRCLNDLHLSGNPTAEILVERLTELAANLVVPKILESGRHLLKLRLSSVELWESPGCSVVIRCK